MDPASTATSPLTGNQPASRTSQGHEQDVSDADLVAAATAGDHQAFAALWDRHAPRLYHLLLRLAGNADLAAELLQDVTVHAWQRLDRFAGRSSFGTWLWSLGRNRALDVLRRRQPTPWDQATLQAPASADGAGEALMRDEQHRLLHRALAQLSVEDREIMILRDFQDYDYQTIADTLDCPLGTVKSRLARARARLRELLAPYLSAEDLA